MPSTHLSVCHSPFLLVEMEKAVPQLSVQQNSKEEGVDLPKRSIMTRPGFGTSGRRVSLLSNHFKVSIKNQNVFFYQYSVKSKCLPLSYIYIYITCI